MSKKPVVYMQTDPRWAKKPYAVKGKETTTVAHSGCGPSCAAMLIETITGKEFTPLDACNWSMDHGYKAVGQGTYYSYFGPQFKAFGIDCWQYSWTNTYHKTSDYIKSLHKTVLNYLSEGYYLIALMKKGRWTSGGHFIVVYDADSKYVYINDPASTKVNRLKAERSVFENEVAYYWVVNAPKYEEEQDMLDEKRIREIVVDEISNALKANDFSEPDPWYKDACSDAASPKKGIITGDEHGRIAWREPVTKQMLMHILKKLKVF